MALYALRPDLLTVAFCIHLHTDHTAGYPDLIFTPWVLERPVPLKVFGPKGMQHMTDHILKAYETDIDFRINGFEKANESGYRVEVTEIESGIIYKDDRVTVEACERFKRTFKPPRLKSQICFISLQEFVCSAA